MTNDARLLNWHFVVPPHTGRLLLLSIDDEMLTHAVTPACTAAALTAALNEGPFTGIVVGDVARWEGLEVSGGGPAQLLARLATALTADGWLYAGFPNRWYPAAPLRRGSFSRRAAERILCAAGLSEIRMYFALPDRRCPAFLVSADRRAELDYFLKRLFFPYVEGSTPRAARLRQWLLDLARWTALRLPHPLRVACGPAMAVVATRPT